MILFVESCDRFHKTDKKDLRIKSSVWEFCKQTTILSQIGAIGVLIQ